MGGIPSNYTVAMDLDLVSPVELSGLPSTYHLNIDSLPKIQIGMDPITINPLTLNPLDIAVRVTEAPSIRAHVPANFSIGFSVLGFQFAAVRLCGEAQVITEPYVPNPCEQCGGAVTAPSPVPVTPSPVVGVPKATASATPRTRKG